MKNIQLFNDHFQNYKSYQIPKAQLIIADIPYNLGNYAYASNPSWYLDGDNKNGESKLAGTDFFDTDKDFRISEFLHFCSKMLVKEPKEVGKAPCMIVFCEFEQQFELITKAKEYGLNNYINLVFRKNFSAQVLKANMKVVGNCEYAVLLYREKLPKFNNNGRMIFNCFDWKKDTKTTKIHPCLPAGQQVFFNNEWKPIEDVKIGENSGYGIVVAKSNHYANKLVEINVGKEKTIATWNHPFLILRGNNVFWVHAEKILEKDFILQKVFVSLSHKPIKDKYKWIKLEKKQKKDILDTHQTDVCEWNIISYGKKIMGLYLQVIISIIKILTKKTILLPILNLSHPLNISGCTLVANLSKGYGLNLVKIAESLKKLIKKIGIIHEDVSTVNYAKNVTLKNQAKLEKFSLAKVGSVKIINQKTKVYNLTLNNIPAFDTKIGVSHNTQKPVALLEHLIELFTDKGDVVIDPVAGSGTTLLAAANTLRKGYGFEIKKDFFKNAQKITLAQIQEKLF